MRRLGISVCVIGVLIGVIGYADAKQKSNVIATVRNHEITEQDLAVLTQKVPEPFRKAFAKKALEREIDTKVFSYEARQKGVEKTAEFKKRLEDEKDRILSDFFLEQLEKNIKVSAEEAMAYYNEHKNSFRTRDRVKATQIHLKTEKEAEEVKALLAKGETFDTLKLKYKESPLPGRLRGQEWIERGRAPKELEAAIFALKKGQVSPLVKGRSGYHLIKVIDRIEAGIKSFGEVRVHIENRLKAEKVNAMKEEYRKKAGVKILSEEYKTGHNSFLMPGMQ